MKFLILVCVFWGGISWAETLHPETLYVAVASNFVTVAKEISTLFEQSSGHKVVLSSGSSGKIFAQIKHGAPYQVFLSADEEKPVALEALGITVPQSRSTYAIGRLTLWSPTVPVNTLGADAFSGGRIETLAIASPTLAPYGLAAQEVLDRIAHNPVQYRLITGENVGQAFQFVQSGNADAGFIPMAYVNALSDVRVGHTWVVPETMYRPIKQDLVILNKGNTEIAQTYVQFLRSEFVRALLVRSGYHPPDLVSKEN